MDISGNRLQVQLYVQHMGGVIPQQVLVAAIMVPGYTDTYTLSMHSFVLLPYHEVVHTVDNASLLVLDYLLSEFKRHVLRCWFHCC